MPNPLPVALVQAIPRPLGTFPADVADLLAEHPETRLLAFPELHLCGVNTSVEELQDAAEPIDGREMGRKF